MSAVVDTPSLVGVREPMPGVTYPPEASLRRYLAEGVLTEETLIGALRQSFRRYADRVALRGMGQVMTYAELDARSDRAALALHRLGLRTLDRVVFQVSNSPALLVTVLGCLKAGLIPVCTLHAHRELEIGSLARHAAARAHLIDGSDPRFDLAAFSKRVHETVPTLSILISVDGKAGGVSLPSLIDETDADEAAAFVKRNVAALDPFQVAVFQLSGGSTGVPKIIPRLQNDYLANARLVIEATRIGQSDTVVAPGPMLHNAGLICFWVPALLSGGCVAIAESLTEDGLHRLLIDCRPSWMYVPKPLMPRMEAALREAPEARGSLRGIISSSGGQEMEARTGVPVFHFFGMTEGIIAFTRPDHPFAMRHGCVGVPIARQDELRFLVPGTETDVPEGEAGELAVRGPYTIRGYYDAPERNAESFTSDGWYRTGDLMRCVPMEGQRALVYEGRLKDLISRGGEKISCDEVERLVRTHPAVLDAAVVPVPDAVYGERGYLFLVPAAGVAVPDVTGIGRHLQSQGLAKFKWPERLATIDSLPTTSAGKINRLALREQARRLNEEDRA